jgi:hypothetical protein
MASGVKMVAELHMLQTQDVEVLKSSLHMVPTVKTDLANVRHTPFTNRMREAIGFCVA